MLLNLHFDGISCCREESRSEVDTVHGKQGHRTLKPLQPFIGDIKSSVRDISDSICKGKMIAPALGLFVKRN
jgi:hypothetical protein